MKDTKDIKFTFSSALYAKIEQYAKSHAIPLEEIIRMALEEFFDIGSLLKEEQKRKKIWDIIDFIED